MIGELLKMVKPRDREDIANDVSPGIYNSVLMLSSAMSLT